ncbi:MAG: FtsB family cell division protein [Desulfobacterales bacterium]
MTFKPWQLKIGLAAAILILAAYLGAILFGDNGLIELNKKKARLEEIQAENQAIEKDNRALYRRVNRLKNDPAYLEYIIRQELSLIGEDEIVFKFKKE